MGRQGWGARDGAIEIASVETFVPLCGDQEIGDRARENKL